MTIHEATMKNNDQRFLEIAEEMISTLELPYHISPNKSLEGHYDIKKGNTTICGCLKPSECMIYFEGIQDILTYIELGDYKLKGE